MIAPSLRPVLAVFVAGVLSGCGTLPDLQPFSTATSQMAASVRAGGKAAVLDTRTLVAAYEQDARQARDEALDAESDHERKTKSAESRKLEESAGKLGQKALELETSWAANAKMVDAIVRYSDSLAAIAAGGKKGQESAMAVGNSLKGFLSAFDAALPAASLVGEIGPIAAKLSGQVLAAIAAKSLEGAVVEAQPAIDEAARVLHANLGNLARINRSLFLELPGILQDPSRAGFNVREERRVSRVATAAHDALRTEIATAISSHATSEEREKALQPLALRARQLEAIIAASQAKLAPVDEKIAGERARGATQSQFLSAAQSAIEEWAAYHRRLGTALQVKTVPSVEALLSSASDLRELLNAIRKKP